MPKHRRRTEEEQAQHKTAARVRRMTDAQICEYLASIYRQGEHSGAASLNQSHSVADFIQLLDAKSGTGNGIGKSTVYKLRKVAQNEGFLNGL